MSNPASTNHRILALMIYTQPHKSSRTDTDCTELHRFALIGLQGFVIIRVIRVSTRVHLLACGGANDRVEGGLGLIVAVEQQWTTLRAPGDTVIRTPERD